MIASLPALFTTLQIAAPAAFLGALLGEYFDKHLVIGVGPSLYLAQNNRETALVWTLGFSCAIVSGLAYFVIGLMGRAVDALGEGDPVKRTLELLKPAVRPLLNLLFVLACLVVLWLVILEVSDVSPLVVRRPERRPRLPGRRRRRRGQPLRRPAPAVADPPRRRHRLRRRDWRPRRRSRPRRTSPAASRPRPCRSR